VRLRKTFNPVEKPQRVASILSTRFPDKPDALLIGICFLTLRAGTENCFSIAFIFGEIWAGAGGPAGQRGQTIDWCILVLDHLLPF
jgi:hypothetical protein